MALRHYQYEQKELQKEPLKATYQDYHVENENNQELKDLLFFLNIVIFAITCVLAIFIFSALKMNTILSMFLALPTGLLILQVLRLYTKKRHKK